MKDFKILIVVPAVLYLASLVLPAASAFETPTHPHEVVRGFWLLAVGWLGIFGGQVAWLANPFGLVATLLLVAARGSLAIVFSLIALLLSLLAFLWRVDLGWEQPIPGRLDIGAYLWMASFAALLICSCLEPVLRVRRA
jgi:hypothetical protein